MGKKNRFIYWCPRISAMILILFLSLLSLDIFEGNYGFWGTVVGLLMHNIPSFVLLGVLIVSWKYEIVGAVVFILAGLIFSGLTIVWESGEPWYVAFLYSLILAGPALITGILFLIGWLWRDECDHAG